MSSNVSASLSRNIVFSLGAYATAVLITFFISPYLIRQLGDARYGVWSLIAEITGYYGFLDLGIRGALTHYVARFAARNEAQHLNKTIATAFWTLCGIGSAAAVAGLVLAVNFSRLFGTGGIPEHEIVAAVSIVSIIIGLNLPMEVLNGILVGHRRMDVSNSIDVCSRVATAFGYFAVLKSGGGLIGLSLIHAAGKVLTWLVIYIVIRQLLPQVGMKLAGISKQALRDLAGYGSQNMVTNLAALVIYRVDLIVVNAVAGLAAVTFYTLGAMMVRYTAQLCAAITRAFTPHLAYLHARDEQAELRRIYLFGVRGSGLAVTGLIGSLLVFGKPFLALWVGEKYVTGPWTGRSDVVMVILLLSQLPRLMQSISWQLLFATRNVTFVMWLSIAEAIANLTMSLILVRVFGIAGVALGTFFPMMVAQGIILPIYILRKFHLSLRRFVLDGVGRPLVVGVIQFLVSLATVSVAVPNSWGIFLIDAAVAALVGGVVAYAVGLNPDDKKSVKQKISDLLPAKVRAAAQTTAD